MDNKKRYQELASKWLNKTISKEEMEEFSTWYNHQQDKEVFIPKSFVSNESEHKQRILNKIEKTIRKQPPIDSLRRKKILIRIAAAATFILCCTIAFLSYKSRLRGNDKQYHVYNKEVAPGTAKATLTLANGEQIALEDDSINAALGQNGLKIKKLDNGVVTLALAADGSTTSSEEEVKWNTISTPKGGEFRVILPDHSLVYLNSASSISFPTRFSEHERRVKLSGEAFFEVEKSRAAIDNRKNSQPFIVSVGTQEITVLGTQFNVNAYEEDAVVTTTLLSGAVKLTPEGNTANGLILAPGEQGVMDKVSRKIAVSAVDLEEALAWKDGYFVFNNESITAIMEKISRWYNIEVSYKGNVEAIRFLGIYDRGKSLHKLLKDIELMGKVECKIITDNNAEKGRRIMVVAK